MMAYGVPWILHQIKLVLVFIYLTQGLWRNGSAFDSSVSIRKNSETRLSKGCPFKSGRAQHYFFWGYLFFFFAKI